MAKFICPYAWRGASVTTDGHFRVCPVSQSAKSKGVILDNNKQAVSIETLENTEDLLNSPTLCELRKRMLSDQDVAETCVRCLNEEGAGIESARLRGMKYFPDFNYANALENTDSDGKIKDVGVEILNLRFGNKCNLACRMCGPSSSDQWYAEWKETRYNGFQDVGGRVALVKENGKTVASPNPYKWVENGKALEFLKRCAHRISHINFSGGEPLLNRAHVEILSYLVDAGYAANISIDYNSNLTVLSDEVLNLWTHFKSLMAGVSVDGSPSVNEYIRRGTNTQHLEKNLKRLNDSRVRGIFWIATTVQIYNAFDLLDLKKWYKDLALNRFQTAISWHILRSPEEMSIYSLPQDLKKQFSEYIQYGDEFSALSEAVYKHNSEDKFTDFVVATARMDQYRKESIKEIKSLWDKISGLANFKQLEHLCACSRDEIKVNHE